MTYLVTLAMQNGQDATVRVEAPNKDEAGYRAAFRAETIYGAVSHVKAARRAA